MRRLKINVICDSLGGIYLVLRLYIPIMDKGKVDKNASMNIFEVKPIKRDFGYKLTAADVFNEFLYVGDDKGTSRDMQEISIPTPFGPGTLRS